MSYVGIFARYLLLARSNVGTHAFVECDHDLKSHIHGDGKMLLDTDEYMQKNYRNLSLFNCYLHAMELYNVQYFYLNAHRNR